jgi:hypothetical protein
MNTLQPENVMAEPASEPQGVSGIGSKDGLCRWHWLTTMPNPRSRATGYDAGQRGWKRHAVFAPQNATVENVRSLRAICGLKPRHGWGDDLYIEDKCQACERLMAKRHNQKTAGAAASGSSKC